MKQYYIGIDCLDRNKKYGIAVRTEGKLIPFKLIFWNLDIGKLRQYLSILNEPDSKLTANRE